MQKYLLQELKDLEKYKDCLNEIQYKEYKKYLYRRILKEVSTKRLYDIVSNEIRAKKSTDQRFEELLGRFKNTKHYETGMDRKAGKIKRLPGTRTNLQLTNSEYCTKKEFEDEFMKYEFDDSVKAKKYLKQFTGLFDDDGWLKV